MNAIEKGFQGYIREVLPRAGIILQRFNIFSANILETERAVKNHNPSWRVERNPVNLQMKPGLKKSASQLNLDIGKGNVHRILDLGNHTQGITVIYPGDPEVKIRYSPHLGEF